MYCTYFEDEMYQCPSCGKFVSNNFFTLLKTWKCPDCHESLLIGVPSIKYTLVRKLPGELKINDSILLSGEETGRLILAVNKSTQKNKVYVAIKGYGGVHIPKDDYQNVVIGSYFEGSWKSNN